MTGSQPNPIDALTADATRGADAAAQQEADPQPEFVGDMPDDPQQAVTYRPEDDQPDGSAR